MTTPRRTPQQAAVLRLQRPPVHQATVVGSDIDHTFTMFVRTIGTWWPVRPFSAGKDDVCDVTIEPHLGGMVYETWQDGTVVRWGELLAWDPPHGFTMSWTCTPAPTEVELTFTSLGPALTRVAVEHRGWDALSHDQLSEDCALPGGYHSGAYRDGWATILGHFATAAQPAPTGHQSRERCWQAAHSRL
jgi:Activator of Hsp90 ATPase homolog 1-like protein